MILTSPDSGYAFALLARLRGSSNTAQAPAVEVSRNAV
jgi:hypothetical protein